ncbi:ATP-dependent acyl-CoA ligase [Salinibacterium sp. GXW1014]|uniref:ATP-dependent acyl-CoA ligase n=1 Tax=Salinibacterium sp. GXW1014 TaxID=3377838 RepID=UPI003839F8EE
MLERRAIEHPDRPLVRFGEHRRTVREVRDDAARVGAMLLAEGVQAGDRVALLMGNRREHLDLILGCAWIGAIAVPINVAARGVQLHHILKNSGARVIAIESELMEPLLALPDLAALTDVWTLGTPSVALDGVRVRDLPRRPNRVPPAEVRPSDTAVILYTSGTTGAAKGVMCPQAQFFWWGYNVSTQFELSEQDVLHTVLPLFHTNALNAFFQALYSGAEIVYGRRFSASGFWAEVTESGATFTYLLGTMVSILMGRPPSDSDRAHSVAAALAPSTPPAVLQAFAERFGVALIDGYGSTETNSVLAASRSEQRPGYMGTVQPGFVARVIDHEGDDVPLGEPGQLVLRNEQPYAFATGYFGMAEKTVEAWSDLWFHTGDRVTVEADGWMRFVDRMNDLIRRRGENISSVAVEEALRLHPDVSEVAVYAVDSELGEDEVMAAIVPRPGAEIDFAELTAFCEPRLAYFAIPRFFSLLEAMPLTENGKVRKGPLREAGAAAAHWDREAAGVVLSRR